MITKPIRFMQIAVNTDHIFGLTPEGDVYYRDKPPYNYATTTWQNGVQVQKKPEDEEKKAWKKLFMEYRVEVPKGGQEREAQPANEPEQPAEAVAIEIIVDEPAHKVYKDAETIKAVQVALKAKGFYKQNNKDDGILGKLTVDGIKAFQKSVNMTETGEIDLRVWNALGLGKPDENETVVEVVAAAEPSIGVGTTDNTQSTTTTKDGLTAHTAIRIYCPECNTVAVTIGGGFDEAYCSHCKKNFPHTYTKNMWYCSGQYIVRYLGEPRQYWEWQKTPIPLLNPIVEPAQKQETTNGNAEGELDNECFIGA